MTATDPKTVACLERTRSAVLNVLVVIGGGIAVSGWVLGRRELGIGLDVRQDEIVGRLSHGLLILAIVASYVVRRAIGSRSSLRDPARRAERFYRSHVLGAMVGALAIPLGFVYGWVVRPELDAIAPFWVAALALGFLSMPRAQGLEDFETPMSTPAEPSP